ncbi:hypothetical protein [Fulvivirga sedimenti]|uniref:Lipocalin-like domain-containing protein n=1 Tax=Fulvivirga sedimenti TaxID=2879465 RepID=A0A9X1HTV4_9BACT|nr:hypothetical protein [Fulvivirga sedimenti]MCA6074880.1 hypothetical protein [Fulvivirga sedimenti]MCA6076057.1 hypothetical protein [Fulvivirga sedimenti]MCA6077185.1 hypothetical protein [Fulvivirga sedimenti]
MKKPIILQLLLVFSSSFVIAQDSQLEKLKMLSGTWLFSPADFSSSVDMPSPPETMITCNEVTETNGLYCIVYSKNATGSFELTQSELMAYDQITDKIHMFFYDGKSAIRAEGSFKGNSLIYADLDMNGNKLMDGTITIEKNKMTQKVVTAGDNPASLTLIFHKKK